MFLVSTVQFLFLRGPFDLQRWVRSSLARSRSPMTDPDTGTAKWRIKPKQTFNHNLQHQQQESCEWLNESISWLLTWSIRTTPDQARSIERKLQVKINEFLSKPQQMSTISLAPVKITDMQLGSNFPKLTWISSSSPNLHHQKNLTINAMLNWHEQPMHASFKLETCILLNWPVEMLSGLPVQLQVSVTALEAPISASISSKGALEIGIIDTNELYLETHVNSLLGQKTKLKDLPKIQQLIQMALEEVLKATQLSFEI